MQSARAFAVGMFAALGIPGCAAAPSASDAGDALIIDWLTVSQTYVIASIDTETDDVHTAYGFDLDRANGNPMGAPTGGCQDVPDFTSPITSATGVDNQFSLLAPTLDGLLMGDGLDGAIRDQIEAGRLLLVLEVSDINSFTNDESVRVHAMLAGVNAAAVACAAHTDSASCIDDTANLCSYASSAMATGNLCSTATRPLASADCRAHTDRASCIADVTHACSWSATAMLCSGIAADQTLSILSDLGTALGSIVGGQISVTLDSLPVTLLAMGHLITLPLHHVRIGGRITQAGITNGELGSDMLVSDFCTFCDFCIPDQCGSFR